MDLSHFSFVFMVFGFICACYGVIANDSLQTLGTFISSKGDRVAWYWLWLATSAVLAVTILFSWYFYGGDISYGRLAEIPRPETFNWYHVAAPAMLVVLTRFGLPVATTFIVLSAFASQVVLEKVLVTAFVGYTLAAVIAFVIWMGLSKLLKFNEFDRVSPGREMFWHVGQWLSTCFLWVLWLTHELGNMAVYLPRQLDMAWLAITIVVMVGVLAIVFYEQGGPVQRVITSKTSVGYVRNATIIDMVLVFILVVFKEYNDIPMSTTWVFVGLLCGRELAIFYQNMDKERIPGGPFPILARDFIKISVGLVVAVGFVLLVGALKANF